MTFWQRTLVKVWRITFSHSEYNRDIVHNHTHCSFTLQEFIHTCTVKFLLINWHNYIKATQLVIKIFKMTRYVLNKTCILDMLLWSKIYCDPLSCVCKEGCFFVEWKYFLLSHYFVTFNPILQKLLTVSVDDVRNSNCEKLENSVQFQPTSLNSLVHKYI